MLVTALEKVFNLSPPEFTRTSYAWVLRFLLKLGSVIGTTMLISLFVTHYSIETLPFIFLVQASLTIVGMLISSVILNRFEIRYLIVFHLFLGSILLFISSFFGDNLFVFVSFLLFVGGITLPQVQILLSNYIEDFFTPGEATRAFPIIESAEIIAGIIGGFLLAEVFPIDLGVRFVYVWSGLMLALSLVIFFLKPHSPKFLHYLFEITHQAKSKKMKNIFTDGFQEIAKIPFLKILFISMFCYWLLFQFIEFQFTKVVHESLAHGDAEGEMAKSLGSLHLFFYSLALLMQFLVAGRIMKYLGTAGGFLFHAVVSLFGVLSLIFGFGPFTAMLVKNNYEVSGVVFKNSYESSYYAFRHGTQRFYRELLEGAVAPAATIVATSILALMNWFFLNEHLPIVTNVFLFFITFALVVLSAMMKEPYTNMVKQHLFHPAKHSPQEHALEILAEQGHKGNIDDLTRFYEQSDNQKFKAHALHLLTQKADPKVVNFLLQALEHAKPDEAVHLLQALEHNVLMKHKQNVHPYLRQKVIKILHQTFYKFDEDSIRIALLKALHQIDVLAPHFLTKIIDENLSSKVLSVCLHLISESDDNEKHFFLQSYLQYGDPFVRAEAVKTLMTSREFKKEARLAFDKFLKTSEEKEKLAFAEKLYSFQSEKSYHALMSWVHDPNPIVRCAVMAALLKLHHYHMVHTFAHELLQANDETLNYVESLFDGSASHLQRVIAHSLLQQSSLSNLSAKKEDLELILTHLTKEKLTRLHKAYISCGCNDEAQYVEDILEKVFQEQNPITSYILAEKAV